MEARRVPESEQIIVKSDLTGVEQVFDRIIGSVSWGKSSAIDTVLSDHALIIAGLLTDGRIYVLSEFHGDYHALLDKMLVFKDGLLVREYYADDVLFPGLWAGLFDVDGLTKYTVSHRNRFQQPVYKNKPEYWKTFRDYQTIANILTYDEDLNSDFEACKLRVEALTRAKKILWRSKFLPLTEKLINQTSGDASEKPLFRAYVSAVWHLDIIARGKEKRKEYQDKQRFPWGSGNLKG